MTDTLWGVTTAVLATAIWLSTITSLVNKITPIRHLRITLVCATLLALMYAARQQWALAAIMAAMSTVAAILYQYARPRPAWWNGQHERIDTPKETT